MNVGKSIAILQLFNTHSQTRDEIMKNTFMSIHNVKSVEISNAWKQDNPDRDVYVRRISIIDDQGNELEFTLFADSLEKIKV